MSRVSGLRVVGFSILLASLTWPSGPPNEGATLAPAAKAEAATGAVRGTFTSLQRLLTRGATSQRDVVVYLRSAAPAEHAPPREPVVVVQEKLAFQPHVLPVVRGTTVRFENRDDVDHNVYSAEGCCSLDLDTAARTTKDHRFDRAGVVSIVCRLHPNMSAWVIVLDEPWFTHVELEKKKGDDGACRYTAAYALEGVPAGAYVLTFWNKKLEPREVPVVIEAGKTVELDVRIEE